MSLPMLQPRPTRVLYEFSVILVTLFVMGFIWLIFYAVIVPVRAGILSSMSDYSNSTTYANFTLADTFMVNLWAYLLVIVVLGLLMWIYHYSQRVMYQ